jgi:hypothetical protein
MSNSDKDLLRFFKDYPVFSKWSEDKNLRQLPRHRHESRLKQKFSVEEYLNKLKLSSEYKDKNVKSILFAHFSPFEYEMEALGLPCYARKMIPTAKIHFTYDKGARDVYRFSLGEKSFNKIDQLDNQYDVIISRSSALKSMVYREHDSQVVENSSLRVNIKTMSLQSNMVLADSYFDEEDMCPPPDPDYLDRTFKILNNQKKENLVVVSGTLWYVKNQLKMFSQINADIIKDFKVVIIGGERDPVFANKIRTICESKGIDYYMIGWVCKELAHHIKSLCKISLIPMDMRKYGQPKGYPRTLGESIGSRCVTLCNKPVTVPSYYKNSCLIYDEDKDGDFNNQLKKCVEIVKNPDYINTFDWGSYSMEDHCEFVLKKCLKMIP